MSERTGGFIGRLPSSRPRDVLRNGLSFKPYVYRGNKPLEEELPDLCAAGCGRRLNLSAPHLPPVCAVCRGYFRYQS